MYPDVASVVLRSLDSTLNIGFGHNDVKYWPTGVLEVLLKAGILQPSDYAHSLPCDECSSECSVEIRFADEPPRAYFDCPCRDDIGRIWVPTEKLRTYSPSPHGLAAYLASELNGMPEELVSGRLWLLGRSEIDRAIIHIMLAYGLDRADGDDVLKKVAARARNQAAVILTPMPVACDLPCDASMILLPLRDVFYVDGKGLRMDISQVTYTAERTQTQVAEASYSRQARSRYMLIEGVDTWRIVYDGVEATTPLKTSKGLRYIAFLLTHPDKEYLALHVIHEAEGTPYERDEFYSVMSTEQLAEEGMNVAGSTDAGEIMDTAYEQYCRKELKMLKKKLHNAEIREDDVEVRQISVTIKQFQRSLSEGIGLGGRHRTMDNPLQRARWRLTKAVQRTLPKIHEAHPTFHEHLIASLKTGVACIYTPTPSIHWDFEKNIPDFAL